MFPDAPAAAMRHNGDMPTTYDAIVVGARCGGAPTAMLLARLGHHVLLLDKARFPSDTLSTHLIHPTGVAALRRWGLDGEVGAPPIGTYSFDFGPLRITGAPRPTDDGVAFGLAPRRLGLDALLVDAARDSGVDVREGVTVEGLLVDRGAVVGVRTTGFDARARVVIGADGRRSRVAGWAGASAYAATDTLAATYYAYWRDLPVDGLEVYVRPSRSLGAFPTDDGLTLVVVSWPRAEFDANRGDVQGSYLRTLDLAPTLAERVRVGARQSRFFGTGDVPGFYREAFGTGWALVGDARHHKDPCTAKGISEAFLDAEALAAALHDVWANGDDFQARLGRYQRERDASTMPMYEFTCQLARLEPPPPEMAARLLAVSQSPEASRDFVSMIAGTVGVPEFFGDAVPA